MTDATEGYPLLFIHDNVQAGSITFGRTRLPVWAPRWEIVDLDEYVTDAEPHDEWKDTAEAFVRDLLDQRRDFARLLLAVADAQRQERGWESHDWGQPFGWERDDDLKAPVVEALRRCLAALEGDSE